MFYLIDISIKRLVRHNPAAFLELIGFPVAPNHITFEDTAIQQRERRADHTCIITDDNGARRGVIYLEYQMVPVRTAARKWVWKWAALLKRFPEPVVMLVVYLHRRSYVTFHGDHREQLAGPETAVLFDAVRFWECDHRSVAASTLTSSRSLRCAWINRPSRYFKCLGAPPTAVAARFEAIENIERLHAMIARYDEQIESWEQLLL